MFQGEDVSGTKAYSLRDHGADLALSRNFRLIEFACRDGSDLVLVHPQLVRMLERIRKELEAPLHISSGFRTPGHNRRIGGARYSRHQFGMAADISTRDHDPEAVAEVAEAIGAGGIGRYRSFTHVDVGTYRRWNG